MFHAEYRARPKLARERRPWNVRRPSKPFLDGWPPLGRVCCISTEYLLYSKSDCMVSLGRPSWTSLELGDYHAPSVAPSSMGRLRKCMPSIYFPWTSEFVSMIRCATCHCPIGYKLCRLCFRGIRHVSFPGWLCYFKCLGQLPINSEILPLPFTFSKISLV